MICRGCGRAAEGLGPTDRGEVRGNTARFTEQRFPLWRCPVCRTIQAEGSVDFRDLYVDYPLNGRRMDTFARATLGNLRRRLVRHGLQRGDRVLDYGCGNGLFVRFLRERGYRAEGFDPYLAGWEERPEVEGPFDWVVANDVIEHTEDPRALLRDAAARLAPGGHLYVGLPDPDGIRDLRDLEPHVMRLHQPFHRVFLPLDRLLRLGVEAGLAVRSTERRSYLDTLHPFANYRFLDELSRASGHVLEKMFHPSLFAVFRAAPYGLVGYFFPSAEEPSAVFQKPSEGRP